MKYKSFKPLWIQKQSGLLRNILNLKDGGYMEATVYFMKGKKVCAKDIKIKMEVIEEYEFNK